MVFEIKYESGSDYINIDATTEEMSNLVREWRDSRECQEECMSLEDYLKYVKGYVIASVEAEATIDGYDGEIL